MTSIVIKSEAATDNGVTTTVNGKSFSLDNISGYSLQAVIDATVTSVQTFDDDDVNLGADTVTETAHGYSTGMKGALTTDGTLPAGLSAQDYFIEAIDANNYGFALTLVDALAGTLVDITAAPDGGIHTATPVVH